ncbi:MAG: hypothetical protein ETSY1_12905 [Candidatus Entotheonella factor]|uniref:DUF1640 domain-containing protein n=1 Tax=Entotheonella factor TaxID=1429438 RepID=W4LPH0_ENTF1|nr:MAG: hypothetical protein ETSY1_12905 [Candidatus Entotheonella factor]
MAEDHVSRDEHRADMAELRSEFKEEMAGLRQEMTTMRGELKEEMAGIRQEIIVLTKTMEANQQAMLLQFQQIDQRFNQMDQQRQEDRQVMLQQFQQVDQRLAQHETRLGSMENWMRTTFVTVALVAIGVATQLFYILMRLGLKPPTGTGGP